jgi:4-hydroxythreonine-4-phosphate dehydrogenase
MGAIVVTQGDPAGIGPELLLRAGAAAKLRSGDRVYADPVALEQLADRLTREHGHAWATAGLAAVRPLLAHACHAGMGQYAALVAGTDDVLAHGDRHLVTAPIDKARAQDEGLQFPGHTEFLAARAQTSRFAMCMVGPRLRVALVTIHVPLREVSALLDTAAVIDKGLLLADALDGFADAPRTIAVLGLNPHAGEKGRLGDEDQRIIAPAVTELSRLRPDVAFSGPWPADGAFAGVSGGRWGAVLAMYHDQGLGPFKLLHFADGINATLGLPFRRASPDHGTAIDIAGKGIADPTSMFAAIDYARGRQA